MESKFYFIIKLLKRAYKNDPDIWISPNFVADFAYNHKIKLTSDEVVYISDNFEKLIAE